MSTFNRSVLQHSIHVLENGNAIVHVREASEALAEKVAYVLAKFKTDYKFLSISIEEAEGVSSVSMVVLPCEPEESERLFIFRCDAALFFQRFPQALRKAGVEDISKCMISSSQGHLIAGYTYRPTPKDPA